ncbi:hypothetical protein LUZ61_020523 [Rhynchospora tenuis]|uniref:Hexosyltransferase n=1 Tax=Rhynchospora tenuis TaxID=198213 RepID=A0AAD5ZD92_9POAL|nr:hypothetical protein LUZ61_020523 [Rhynchospora tenuis]
MTHSFFSKEPPHLYLLFFSCLLLLLTIFVVYLNDFRLQSLFSARSSNGPSVLGPVITRPDFRVLIGIITTPWTFERRHLLRHVYSKSLWPAKNVTDYLNICFVICNGTNNEEKISMLELEMMAYDDIIVLNCTETIVFSKTHSYFTSLPDLFGRGRPYDYVMKTDDDTYLRLDALVASLRDKPRNDMYYGVEIPCNGTEFNFWIPAPFMTGLGYVLSWDLVEWMADSEAPDYLMLQPEDMMVGWWLQMGEKGKNRYNNFPMMYDFRGDDQEPNCFRHDLTLTRLPCTG